MRNFGALGSVLYGLRPGLHRGLCDELVPAVFKACGITVAWLWQGRILVFSAKGGKLNLVCEKEVKGAAYTVHPFQVKCMLLTVCRFLQLREQ
jgi:hypothetical protein